MWLPQYEVNSSPPLFPALISIVLSSDFFKKLTSNPNDNDKYQSSCGIEAKKPWAITTIKQCFYISSTMIAKFIQHFSKRTSALSLPPSTKCNFRGSLKASLEVTHLLRKIPWNQQSPLYFTRWFTTKALLKAALGGTVETSSGSSKFLLVATSTWGVSKHWELMTCQIYECFLYQ